MRARPASPRTATDQLTKDQAHDACLRLLAVRARSRGELARRLHAKGCDSAVTETVLDRLAGVGLVDDVEFARSWVRQRHEHSGRGRRALGCELRDKGIDDETAAQALGQIDDEAETERARELVRSKVRRSGIPAAGQEHTAAVRRLVGMLARRGFEPAAAFAVVRAELALDDVVSGHADQE